MLLPRAVAVGSQRDGDGNPQAPRDSEQPLPATMPRGEGKIFGNSGLFWFSAIPCAAPGALLSVCASWEWLQP